MSPALVISALVCVCPVRLDLIDNLLPRLSGDRFSALGTVSGSDSGEKDAEKIVDFGDGSNGTSRTLSTGFLRNGDCGRETGNLIDIGLGQLTEELPGVTGETFDVAALSFGIEGIEGERAFAGAADSGEADQFIAWQNKVDVLQIVLPCTFNDDVGH